MIDIMKDFVTCRIDSCSNCTLDLKQWSKRRVGWQINRDIIETFLPPFSNDLTTHQLIEMGNSFHLMRLTILHCVPLLAVMPRSFTLERKKSHRIWIETETFVQSIPSRSLSSAMLFLHSSFFLLQLIKCLYHQSAISTVACRIVLAFWRSGVLAFWRVHLHFICAGDQGHNEGKEQEN
jgi:hypothetical protein